MEVAPHVVRDAPDVVREPVEVAVALPASILRYDSRRARATSVVLQTRLGRPAEASGTTPSLPVHLVAAGSVSRDRPSVVYREPPSDQGRSESETYRTRRAEWTRRTAECLAIRRALPPGGVTRRVVSVRASLVCRFPHLGPGVRGPASPSGRLPRRARRRTSGRAPATPGTKHSGTCARSAGGDVAKQAPGRLDPVRQSGCPAMDRRPEQRTASLQNRVPSASLAASIAAGARLWCSIHVRIAGEIHPATSRMRSWSAAKSRAKIGW